MAIDESKVRRLLDELDRFPVLHFDETLSDLIEDVRKDMVPQLDVEHVVETVEIKVPVVYINGIKCKRADVMPILQNLRGNKYAECHFSDVCGRSVFAALRDSGVLVVDTIHKPFMVRRGPHYETLCAALDIEVVTE